MDEATAIMEASEFQELTMQFLLVVKTARTALNQRIIAMGDEPILDAKGQVSPVIRKTTAIGGLQIDSMNEAEESWKYLAERYLINEGALNLDDSFVDTHMRTMVENVAALKSYFGHGSGYSAAEQTQVHRAIDIFMDTVAMYGFSSGNAVRGT